MLTEYIKPAVEEIDMIVEAPFLSDSEEDDGEYPGINDNTAPEYNY